MNKVIIIAEAGVNHNGDLSIAKQLIDAAKEAGADYVKFQTFKADKLVSKDAVQADYQIKNIGKEGSQYEMLKKLELKEEDFASLKQYADRSEIGFLSSPFDEESLELLVSLELDYIKLGSGEITNKPLLQKVASYNQPTIISTGMCNLEEVNIAVELLVVNGLSKSNLTVLHCNTEYPTPFEDVNLKAMDTMRTSLELNIGYSDHSLGIEVPIAAVALGANCIEKHFTIDRSMSGPDHAASLEPAELKQMVDSIRNIEKSLGHGRKEPSPSERKNIVIARKSIHIKNEITSGHKLTRADLIMKRPGSGISPMDVDEVVGKCVKKSMSSDCILRWEDIQ